MSKEHNDGIDAIRYASDAWRRSRDELLNRPTFRVDGIIDKTQPQISEKIEANLRRRLLEGIEGVLCDGEYHVVKIEREEDFRHLLPFDSEGMEVHVTYTATLTEVQHRHYLVADVWNDYNRRKKSTGRNHRKKDRAQARRLRAERKKLAARLKTHE